ncbi:MAG TPA: glycosyltransferase family 39 protein [Anaeromyxobacteraceae bacterium]|nr:glycosyltransferase family 39 protein [Anaeromyxobacteraceae bacterium]
MPVTQAARRKVWAIALAAGVARLALFRGLDLYADEAYYWLWSRRLAAGYFDHPPMVAWLIRLSTAAVGGELGVRILFVVCGVLAVVFAALVASELSDDPVAPVIAALLAAAAPILTLTGGLALPDAPVEAAYGAATWLVARARGRGWLWAGVAVGLALLSKLTAGLLAPALFLLVAWDPELRRELRAPWPWLGAAVAVALFLPTLVWNARNGWIELRFQLWHGFASTVTVRSVLDYLGGLLAGPGPVVLILGVARLARARTSALKRVAAATFLPMLVTFAAATRSPVEANWGALVYPALAGAAAAALASLGRGLRRALVGFSLATGAAAALLFGLEVRNPALVSPDTPFVERFRGWREYGERAREAAARACAGIGSPPGCDGADPFVFAPSYQEAAALAYYAGWRRFGPTPSRPSQFDLWFDPPPAGSPVVQTAGGPPRLFAAGAAGPPASFQVLLKGRVIHRGEVQAFLDYRGQVRRSGGDLHSF